MGNAQNTDPRENKKQPEGKAENEKDNAMASNGPVTTSNAGRKSELQDNDADEETDDISGDLSGNAAGNIDAEDQ